MPIYLRRNPPAGGQKWKARPLSGFGFIDPATIAFVAQSAEGAREGGGGIFDVFGPTGKFQEEQTIRDEFEQLAKAVLNMIPRLPPDLKSVVEAYQAGPIWNVFLRGAVQADVDELKRKIAEWSAVLQGRVSVLPADSISEAGFPWYVWIIAAGLLLPLILKKGGK